MTKPEWGTKRACHSCGAKFYDMKRSPVTCPKCSATVETDFVVKTRRSRASQADLPSEQKIIPLVGDEDAVDLLPPDLDVDLGVDDVEVDDELIEDTSDLGEDDDDMAEVIEHVDKDDDV